MTIEKKVYADFIREDICKKNMRYAYDLFRIFATAGTALGLFGLILGMIPVNYPLLLGVSAFCIGSAVLSAGILIGINIVNYEIQIWGKN